MKLYLLIFFLFSTYLLFGQDTLVLNSGRIVPAKVIAIDSTSKLVFYLEQEDSVVKSFSSITYIRLHSENISKEGWITPYSIEDPNIGFIIKERSTGPFSKPSKFVYGKTSLGLNLVGPLSEFGFYTCSSNPVLAAHIERQVNDRKSIRIPFRTGLSYFNDTIKSDDYFYTPRKEIMSRSKETFFETGIELINYLSDFKQFNFYYSLGIYGGVNRGLTNEQRRSNDTISGPDWISYHESIYFTGKIHAYWRASIGYGVKICLTEKLLLGLEIGVFGGPLGHEYHVFKEFYLNPTTGKYELSLETNQINQLNTRIGYQGAINLIYNFHDRIKPREL